MSLRKKGLVLAMEMDNEDEMMDTDDSMMEMEETTSVTEDDADSIEEVNDAVEDAAEDSETLERIKDTMEGTLEDGEGMTESAAEIAEVAVEAICARLGIRNVKVMPAMESFGSSSSRATATRIAIESIGENISKAWKAIMQALANAWDKLTKFVMGMYNAIGALEKYNEGLVAKVVKLSAGVEKSDDILDKSGLAKSLSINEKANLDTSKKLITYATKFLDFSNTAADTSISLAGDLVFSTATKFDAKGFLDDATSEIKGLLGKVDASLKDSGGSGTETNGPISTTTVELMVLAGNTKYKIVSETNSDDSSYKLDLVSADGPEKVATMLEALDKDDINELLDKTSDLIKYLKDSKETKKKFDKVQSTIKKAGESVIKALDKSMEEDDKKVYGTLRKSLTSLSSFSTKMASKGPAIGIKTVKAAQTYAAASISNLKVKS